MLKIYNNHFFKIEEYPKVINSDSYLILKSSISQVKDILLQFYSEQELSYQPTTYERLNIISRAIVSEELSTPILNWDIIIDDNDNIIKIENICKLTKIIIQLLNSINIMNKSFEILICCKINSSIKKYGLENILENDSEKYINTIRVYNISNETLDKSNFIKKLNLENYSELLYNELSKSLYQSELVKCEDTKSVKYDLINYLTNISNNENLKNIISNNKTEEKVKKIFYYIISVFISNKNYKSSVYQLFNDDLDNILRLPCDYSKINELAKNNLDKNNNKLKWYNFLIKRSFFEYIREIKPSLKPTILEKILNIIGQVEYANNLDLCYFSETQYTQLFEIVNNEKYNFILNTKNIINYYIDWCSSYYSDDSIKTAYRNINLDKISAQKNSHDILYSYNDFNNILNYLYNNCAKSLRDKQCVVFEIFNSFKYSLAYKDGLNSITLDNYKSIIKDGLSFQYLENKYCLDEILENSIILCDKLIEDTKKDKNAKLVNLLFAPIEINGKECSMYPTTIKNFINKSIKFINNSNILNYEINSNVFIQKQLSNTLIFFKLLKLSETGVELNNKEQLLDILFFNHKTDNIIDNIINNNNKKVIYDKIDSYINDFLKNRNKFI